MIEENDFSTTHDILSSVCARALVCVNDIQQSAKTYTTDTDYIPTYSLPSCRCWRQFFLDDATKCFVYFLYKVHHLFFPFRVECFLKTFFSPPPSFLLLLCVCLRLSISSFFKYQQYNQNLFAASCLGGFLSSLNCTIIAPNYRLNDWIYYY